MCMWNNYMPFLHLSCFPSLSRFLIPFSLFNRKLCLSWLEASWGRGCSAAWMSEYAKQGQNVMADKHKAQMLTHQAWGMQTLSPRHLTVLLKLILFPLNVSQMFFLGSGPETNTECHLVWNYSANSNFWNSCLSCWNQQTINMLQVSWITATVFKRHWRAFVQLNIPILT